MIRREALVRAIVLALVAGALRGGEPGLAAILPAVPETVRVNVAGLGVSYAEIGSTGAMTATAADGRVLYQGQQRTLVRRNVRRAEGTIVQLPPAKDGIAPEDRESRLELIREARRAASEPALHIVTIPFEFSLLQGSSDPLGTPILSSDKIQTVAFRAEFGYLNFNGRLFRGTLEVTTDDEGDMIVVNTVRTADYLPSVIGAEEPSTWHPEALAAQAIAARTYLVTHLARHDHYDIEGDVRDQAYEGLGSEADSTRRAVERTAGVVATYGGRPISALFSANAGGITEDSENVFANALPYLRSVPSPGDELAKDSGFGRTSYEWNREFTAPQLGSYLAQRGINIGIPQRIDVLQASPAGRPTLVRITGDRGTKDIGKDQGRYYFGLKSNLFKVRMVPGGGLEWVSYRDTVRIMDMEVLGSKLVGTTFERVLNSDRELVSLRTTGYVYELPDRFVFDGKGFGHSVGMSQWGAQGMALRGSDYEQILKHYYQGIELTNIGGA